MPDSRYIALESVALPVIAIAGATAFFYYATPIVVPVIMAVFLAYILSPFVFFLNRLKLPHFLSVILILLAALAVAGFLAYVVVLQVNDLALRIPVYWQKFILLVEKWKIALSGLPAGLGEELQNLDLSTIDPVNFAQIGKYAWKGLSSLFSVTLSAVLIFFLTFYILNDQKSIQAKLVRVFGKGQKEFVAGIISQVNAQIRAFIFVKFWTTVALSLFFTLGLMILGVSYPYIWGPLAGILNLVPFVGSVVGAIPPIIISVIESSNLWQPFMVLIFFTAVQLVESNVVSPKLMSNKSNLSPLAVLIATMYWGWLWGGMGVLLAVPITAALKIICDNIESLKPIGIILSGERD